LNLIACEESGIDSFQNDHAWIATEFPIQLPVTDINRVNLFGAALQHAVGEPTGRRPDVDRQAAVKALVREVDLVLVIGSRNSSNSNRLVEVARDAGVASHLIEDESAIDEAWLEAVDTVGITSGASAPESLVRRVVDWFAAFGVTDVDELHAVHEDVAFNLPREIRRALPQVDGPRSSAR